MNMISAIGLVTYSTSPDWVPCQTRGHYLVDPKGTLHIANDDGLICGSWADGFWCNVEVAPE